MATIPPFDIPPEPAQLPNGESHSLPDSYFNELLIPPAPAPVVSLEERLASLRSVDDFAAAHMQWVRDCTERKLWVKAKHDDWKRRRAERAMWEATILESQKQWDAYVEEARAAYKAADAYPVPERPLK